MPSRDFFKTADRIPETWLPSRYTVGCDDCFKLLAMSDARGHDGALDAFAICIRYGYVMGHRATVKGVYKEVSRKRRPSTTTTNHGRTVGADYYHTQKKKPCQTGQRRQG